MAEEPQQPTPTEQAAPVVLTDKDPVPPTVDKPVTTDQTQEKAVVVEEEAGEKKADAEAVEDKSTEEQVSVEDKSPEEQVAVEDKSIAQSVSFKEESNVVSDLPEAQKKALDDLKNLIQDALNKHQLTAPAPSKAPPATEPEKKEPETEAEKKDDVTAAQETEKKEVEAEKKETEAEKKEIEAEKKKEPEEVVVAEESEKKEIEAEKKEDVVVVVEVIEKKEDAVATGGGGGGGGEATEKKETEGEGEAELAPEEVEIWGIPLLGDERSDVVLLKFLRARDFKVKEAFTMIRNTVRWRKEFGIEKLVEEDLGSDWEKVVFAHGHDKEGHPVYYNVFGEFENKELYQKSFGDEEKRERFIRWRIQLLEKSVRKLDLSPKGISTIVQVNDLKNSPGLGKRELRQATSHALQLLQDNYPEFVAKQIFINVPWWYLAFSRMISPFLTQRTKSKFFYAGPSKSPETLFRYIAPELVPVQFGGLSRVGAEQEFTTADPVTEVTVKPATKHAVEIPVSEKSHLLWEIRVVGWDVTYGAEFVPSAEDGYTVIVQKSRKIGPTDETVVSNAFKIGEAGKVVLTIDNQTSKKKKLLYRSKTKPISD